jgi:hypothetical protein
MFPRIFCALLISHGLLAAQEPVQPEAPASDEPAVTDSDRDIGVYNAPYGLNNPLEGLDNFAWTAIHESQHYEDWASPGMQHNTIVPNQPKVSCQSEAKSQLTKVMKSAQRKPAPSQSLCRHPKVAYAA